MHSRISINGGGGGGVDDGGNCDDRIYCISHYMHLKIELANGENSWYENNT